MKTKKSKKSKVKPVMATMSTKHTALQDGYLTVPLSGSYLFNGIETMELKSGDLVPVMAGDFLESEEV